MPQAPSRTKDAPADLAEVPTEPAKDKSRPVSAAERQKELSRWKSERRKETLKDLQKKDVPVFRAPGPVKPLPTFSFFVRGWGSDYEKNGLPLRRVNNATDAAEAKRVYYLHLQREPRLHRTVCDLIEE